MVALPDAPGLVRIVVHGTFNGRGVANILHAASGAAAFTTGDLIALATSVRAAWVAQFIPLQTSSYLLTAVDCVDLTSDTAFTGTQGGSTAGTAGVNAQGAQVAACITWRIGRRYRGGHPRTYLVPSGSTAAYSLPGSFSASYVASMTSAANAFLAAVNSTSTPSSGLPWQLVCPHYYVPGGSVAVPPVFRHPVLNDPITAGSLDSRLDTQRRRLGRDV
jgi:hypothetical protein